MIGWVVLCVCVCAAVTHRQHARQAMDRSPPMFEDDDDDFNVSAAPAADVIEDVSLDDEPQPASKMGACGVHDRAHTRHHRG